MTYDQARVVQKREYDALVEAVGGLRMAEVALREVGFGCGKAYGYSMSADVLDLLRRVTVRRIDLEKEMGIFV